MGRLFVWSKALASSNTKTAVRQEILKRHSFLGSSYTADSFANGPYVDDDSVFRKAAYGSGHFRDQYVFRYNRSGDDILRQVTTVDTSTGRATVAGGNWSNTTDNDYELWGTDPLEVNESIITAQRRYRSKHLFALTGGRIAAGPVSDYDMERSGVAYWDGTSGSSAASNITPTKSTTDLFTGTQALLLTATGASGSVRGEKMRCQAGQTFMSAVLVRADVGTIGFQWYNLTGAANFSTGTEITYAGEDWVMIIREDTVPSGGEEMQPRFSLSGASDIGYAGPIFGPYFQGQRVFNIPSTLDETYEIKALRPSRYGVNIASRVYDAYSREFYGDLLQPQDFYVEHLIKDANPTRIQLYRELPAYPIWISAERDLYASGETLSTEASTTSADIDMLIALTMEDWIENKALPRIEAPAQRGKLAALLAEYKKQLLVEEIARPSLPRKERAERRAWVA